MSTQSEIAAIGIDFGASRTKIAHRGGEKPEEFRCFPTGALSEVTAWARSQGAIPIGLTGAGAASFADQAGIAGHIVDEFTAWAMGSRPLLRRAQLHVEEPFVLVSLGTGTTVLRVETDSVTRVGGTSLGGGTLMGLAALICDCRDFDALCGLAAKGDRREVDLVLADLYPPEHSPLPGEATASSFARIAVSEAAASADIAHRAAGLMGLLGEQIGELASAIARAEKLQDVVFGGSALRNNPILTGLLQIMVAMHGQRAHVLPDGEYAGAMGALLAATASR